MVPVPRVRAPGGSPGCLTLGTRSNFQVTLGSGAKHGEAEGSPGENLAGSNAGAFPYGRSDSGQGWQCPPPRASAGLGSPRPPAPARSSSRPRRPGTADPSKEGAFSVAISVTARRPRAVTTVPSPQPPRPAQKTRTLRPAPRSRTPALTFPRCSALLAHSP